MKHLLALLVFVLCVSPVFAENTGWALDASSDGSAGVGYYQSNWAAGLSGRYSISNVAGVQNRGLLFIPWAAYRHPLSETAKAFAGISWGYNTNGLKDNQTITNDLTPALFVGGDVELTAKLLLRGEVSLSARSATVGTSTAYTSSEMSSSIGLSYFL